MTNIKEDLTEFLRLFQAVEENNYTQTKQILENNEDLNLLIVVDHIKMLNGNSI